MKFVLTISMESNFGDEGEPEIFVVEANTYEAAEVIAEELEEHFRDNGAHRNSVEKLDDWISDHSQLPVFKRKRACPS